MRAAEAPSERIAPSRQLHTAHAPLVRSYADCIALKPGGGRDAKLLCNRSLVLLRAGRAEEAAGEASRATRAAPAWPKAWFRLGAALAGRGDALGAVDALACATRLEAAEGAEAGAVGGGKPECAAALAAAVRRCTREQQAALLLRVLDDDAVASEQLGAPAAGCHSEAAPSPAERAEAMFAHIALHTRDQPPPGDYAAWLPGWLTGGWSRGLAHIHRAALALRCARFARAADDAAQAVRLCTAPGDEAEAEPGLWSAVRVPGGGGALCRRRVVPLAWAWTLLGDALAAQPGHPGRDAVRACGCYARALAADPDGGDAAASRLADAAADLAPPQLAALMDGVYSRRGGGAPGAGLGAPLGAVARVRLALAFPSAQGLAAAGGAARAQLRAALAAAAGVPPARCVLQRVRAPPPPAGQGGLVVDAALFFDPSDQVAGRPQALALAAARNPAGLLAGAGAACAALGVPALAAGCAPPEVEPVVPPPGGHPGGDGAAPALEAALLSAVMGAAARLQSSGDKDGGGGGAAATAALSAAAPPPPARALALVGPAWSTCVTQLAPPVSGYRLVRSDGAPVERRERHPFCLSRLLYDPHDRGPEAWAQPADGSLRWRQSAAEVVVRLLAPLPPGCTSAGLAVSIAHRSLRVATAAGGVLLQGRLERAVVPDESVWTLAPGEGLVLTLAKANVELAASGGAAHGDTWWPRLFTHHPAMAWDDDDKDLSDLPQGALAERARAQHRDAIAAALEAAHRRGRDGHAERDDVRRRARQERLHELRGGAPTSWVALDRANPPRDIFGPAPAQPEAALVDAVRAEAAALRAAALAAAVAAR